MPTSERTLRKWRKEALESSTPFLQLAETGENLSRLLKEIKKLSSRMLSLTQELLDQHLLKK